MKLCLGDFSDVLTLALVLGQRRRLSSCAAHRTKNIAVMWHENREVIGNSGLFKYLQPTQARVLLLVAWKE
jgi:hypothetical protein